MQVLATTCCGQVCASWTVLLALMTSADYLLSVDVGEEEDNTFVTGGGAHSGGRVQSASFTLFKPIYLNVELRVCGRFIASPRRDT